MKSDKVDMVLIAALLACLAVVFLSGCKPRVDRSANLGCLYRNSFVFCGPIKAGR